MLSRQKYPGLFLLFHSLLQRKFHCNLGIRCILVGRKWPFKVSWQQYGNSAFLWWKSFVLFFGVTFMLNLVNRHDLTKSAFFYARLNVFSWFKDFRTWKLYLFCHRVKIKVSIHWVTFLGVFWKCFIYTFEYRVTKCKHEPRTCFFLLPKEEKYIKMNYFSSAYLLSTLLCPSVKLSYFAKCDPDH